MSQRRSRTGLREKSLLSIGLAVALLFTLPQPLWAAGDNGPRVIRHIPLKTRLAVALKRPAQKGKTRLAPMLSALALSAALLTAGCASTGIRGTMDTGHGAPPAITNVEASKMAKYANKLIDKELVFKQHSATSFKIPLGEHARLFTRSRVQGLEPGHALVRNNADRVAFLAEKQARGETYTWGKSSNQITLGGNYTLFAPEGGWVSIFGTGELHYTKIAPHKGKLKAMASTILDTTDKPILGAQELLSEAPGTEVVILAKGTYGGSLGLGHGWTTPGPGTINFTIKAGTEIGQSEAKTIAIVMTRLSDGNRVRVAIHDVDETRINGFTGLRVGVDSHLADKAKGTVGTILGKAGDRLVEQLLNIRAGYHAKKGSSSGEIAHTVIDFDRQATYSASEQTKSQYGEAGPELKIGPLKLYRAISRANGTEGTVKFDDGREVSYGRTLLHDSSEHVLNPLGVGRKQELRGELVSYHFSGEPEQTYLRTTLKEKDYSTSGEDAARIFAIAKTLSAQPKDPSQLEKTSKMGKSRFSADAYVSDKGLEIFEGTPQATLDKFFATVYRNIESAGQGKGSPEAFPWLQARGAQQAQLVELLKQGPESNTGATTTIKTSQERYAELTNGRSLATDTVAFATHGTLLKLHSDLQNAKTPQARAQAFFEARKELSADGLLHLLSTISAVAGPKHVLIDQMKLDRSKGGAAIEFEHTGFIADPQWRVEAMLDGQ